MRSFCWIITLCAALTSCANQPASQNSADSKVPTAPIDKLRPYLNITTPSGAGPFPAVVMVSGCSGFDIGGGFYDIAQSNLTKSGFVVARADYLKSRGENQCDGGSVSGAEGAADVMTVVEYLTKQPFIKGEAINILGWSYGGGIALNALSKPNSGQIASVVSYYPACQAATAWTQALPTLVLFGEADNVVSLSACESIFAKSGPITLKTYPGAFHGFDNPAFTPPVEYRFGTLGYNEAAATQAQQEVNKFLKR